MRAQPLVLTGADRKIHTIGLTGAGLGDQSTLNPGSIRTLFAGLDAPQGVAVDGAGNVYAADTNNSVIRKFDTAGNLTVVAGEPGSFGSAGDNGLATNASLNRPTGVAVDPAGNVYIADAGNYRVRKVDPNGITPLTQEPARPDSSAMADRPSTLHSGTWLRYRQMPRAMCISPTSTTTVSAR